MRALSYGERQSLRWGRDRTWKEAARSGQVSRWQAFRARCQVRWQILHAAWHHWRRKHSAK